MTEDLFLKESDALRNLRALEEIEKNSGISQRELSSRLGVALGITNSLLKTLGRKGLIKIRGENNRSLTYHLTHAGVLAKSALAMRWTLNTIDYYRQARSGIAEKLCLLADQGAEAVVLYGDGELIEIAAVVAPEAGLKLIGIAGPAASMDNKGILGYPCLALADFKAAGADGVVVCAELTAGELEALRTGIDPSMRVYDLMGAAADIGAADEAWEESID